MKRRVRFKRRRQGKTDYKARLTLLKSGKFRLVARKTSNNIIAQIVNYLPEGDEVMVSVDLIQLKKEFGWQGGSNVPAAYLVGYLLGQRAKKHKISEAILDVGMHPATKGGKMFAIVKGAIDAGLTVPCDEGVFPSEDRIKGKHIKDGDVEKQFEELKSKVK
ncbi:MAG: 50S ribosomal protein L18 [Candidatus Altiarchaeota archaeon]|nr:50S ribosomal protein L18 [Candidatus Altiarchaeota archaeon]